MAFRFAVVLCLLMAAIVVPVCSAEMPLPKADDTGMVPGDLILGNMNTFPGHAGIYLGKWEKLPEALRTKYAKLYDGIIIYSRNDALKDSYLVIDSYMPWVGIRSFAEQFTNYYTGHGRRVMNPKGALSWESERGGAIQYHDPWSSWGRKGMSLPIADRRRWKILDEALMCVQEKVGYAQERLLGVFPKYWDMMKEKIKDKPDYRAFKIDCITLCHWAYWRGAGIDLSPGGKLLPVLLPGDYDSLARKHNLYRAVLLEPVYVEAVLLGKWKGTGVGTIAAGKPARAEGAFQVLLHPTEEGKFHIAALNPKTLELPDKIIDPVPMTFERQRNDELHMTCTPKRTASGATSLTARFDPVKDQLTVTIDATDAKGKKFYHYSNVLTRVTRR